MSYHLDIHHIPSGNKWTGKTLNLTEESYTKIKSNLHHLKTIDITLNNEDVDIMIPQSILVESVISLIKSE